MNRKRILKFILLSLIMAGLLPFLCWYAMASFSLWQYLPTALPASAACGLLLGLLRFRGAREYEDIEHGSSRWGTKKDFAPLAAKERYGSIILSRTEQLSMDGRQTQLANHVIVLGDPGSGKSRNYVKPNVCQMNASYIITDPSGEHLFSEGKMLKDNGYRVRVFNITSPKQSLRFNPLRYCTTAQGSRKFIEVLMTNTSGDTSHPQHNEDFWVKAERLWFMAHIAYLAERGAEEQRNIPTLVKLLNLSMAKEDDESFQSPVDLMFEQLEREDPASYAAKQYRKFKLAAGKTLKSILISVGVRLADFEIPEIADLVSCDELELDRLGMEKTALFIVMDESDTTYNYLVAILLDTLFHQNISAAKQAPGGRLKYPLRCIIDEIANIGKIPRLDVLIATTRKYRIFYELIWQDVSQIKAKYRDDAPVILANCPVKLFLGGSGEETTKYVSEQLLGKATIDTVSYTGSGTSGSLGKSSYSANEQKTGRALLDQTELARLPREECIVFIKGYPPFRSKKYDVRKHPRYRLLADGDTGGFVFDRNEGKRRTVQTNYVTMLNANL